MAMRYIEGGLKRIGVKDFAKIFARVGGKFGRDIPSALKPIPFGIEIPTVSEGVYAETRRAVEAAIPGVFFVSIRSVTMEDLLAEDKRREQRGKRGRLGFVHYSRNMRATLPPAMEAFIDPQAIRIKGSNSLSIVARKAEIARVAESYRERLPEALRGNVVWHMPDPSTMSQLEDAWIDADRGLLLPDYFAITNVKTVGNSAALVGREDPRYLRSVVGWNRGDGLGLIFAVAVGVLPRKLAA